jgi:GDP-L-fucose synthase
MKKILVTGANSFLGHHVMPKLRLYATNVRPTKPTRGRIHNPRFEILAPTSKELDLLNREAVLDYVIKHKPDTILHMAAKCGGIGANKAAPAEFVHDNLRMTLHLFDGIRFVNRWSLNDGVNYMQTEPVVTHFYGLGSVCGYPKFCPVPFKEDDLWNGYPEETNAPYGNYKRMMMVMQQAFRQQWGLKGVHLIPVNLYGEHDHFDLKNSHVIPALLRKFLGAKNSQSEFVEVWGDGTPTREFLYAGDCADAIVKAVYTELDTNDPINIGTGDDISISDLANLIKEVVGFEGEVRFTGEVSVNGQPKRRLDVSRAKEILGFEAQTKLRDGLKKTLAWYKEAQSPKEEQMQTQIITEPKITEEFGSDAINRGLVEREVDIAKIANEIIDTTSVTGQKPQAPYYKTQEPKSTVFVKATNDATPIAVGRPQHGRVRATDGRELEGSIIQRFVKEIRAAVGEPDKLKLIAQEVNDSEDLVSDSREFLKSLIFRIERLPISGEQAHAKAVKEWKNLSEKGKEIKATKELLKDPSVLSVPFLDININDGYVESFTVSLDEEKCVQCQNPLHDGICTCNRNKEEVSNNFHSLKNDSHTHKLIPTLSPTDWLVRTGHFTREEAERIAAEGKKEKPDWRRVVKRSPIDGESVKVPELKERPFELPKEPEVERDLKYYAQIERFKRAKAQKVIVGLAGGSNFRRSNTVVDEDRKCYGPKTTDYVEEQFEIATQEFIKKYGIVPDRNLLEKRGKRGTGNLIGKYTRKGDVSDTEIMAAMLISDKIRLPSRRDVKELTSILVANPLQNEEPAPLLLHRQGQVLVANPLQNEEPVNLEPKPEFLKTPPKVEEKKKTIFGTVKGIIKSVLKKVKLI